MTQSPSARVLLPLLYVSFALGAFLVVTMPFLWDTYMDLLYDSHSTTPGYRRFVIPFCMLVGTLGLWIVAELIGTLRTVSSGPFRARNVGALRRMGIAGLLAFLLFVCKCFLFVTPLTLGGALVLFICSLAAFTLSDLFRQAVDFKQENDLTI